MTRHTVDIGLATVRHAYLRRAGGGHAQLIVLRLSHNHLYSGHTVWQGQSNQYSTNPLNSSPPSTLFYIPGEFRSVDTHPTDPLGLCTGPEIHGEPSVLVCQ